jgi:hypothetical protein
VRAITDKTSRTTADQVGRLSALEKQISDKLVAAGPVTASDLAPLQAQESQIRAAMDKDAVETALAIRNILTAEQLRRVAQVRDKLENLRSQMEELMGPGPGDPMAPMAGGMVVLPPN